MGESEDQESDFVRVIVALFKEDIEDAIKAVYKNRIAPTFKRTVADSLKDIVDRLFGTSSTVSNVPAGSLQNNQKTDYTKSFKTGSVPVTTVNLLGTSSSTSANTGKAAASSTNYNGLPNYVTVSSYNEAQNVVNAMNDIIRADGEVSVNDFFDFSGKSNIISGSSTASRYGWYNIDGHTITEMADGQYMLSMPRYEYLGKGN